jgi:spermidine/putrescine ABC transporter ATP-binding subunit
MMIAGFEYPDAGRILLDSRDITFAPPHRRNIGVAFQNYALFPHMTVFENVAFSLKMRDLPSAQIRARVMGVLELVQLADLHLRFPRQLSGGQQQRVALARALVFEPSVLLLDEPLGALDRLLRERMQLELRRVHRQLGTTMIYVTHDQDEALVLSDRIVVMNQGRIEQIGAPMEIYESPASKFVAEFIGETNFISGQILSCGPAAAVVQAGPLRVSATSRMPVLPGASVVLAIRPEKIAIGRSASSDQYEAVIEDVLFVGQSVKYVARIGDAISVTVKQQRGKDSIAFAPGDRVRLSLNQQDAQIFLQA